MSIQKITTILYHEAQTNTLVFEKLTKTPLTIRKNDD